MEFLTLRTIPSPQWSNISRRARLASWVSKVFVKVPLVDAVKQIADLQEVKELLEALETLKAEAQQVKTRAEQLDSLKIQLKDGT